MALIELKAFTQAFHLQLSVHVAIDEQENP